jgi:hypothetical protein
MTTRPNEPSAASNAAHDPAESGPLEISHAEMDAAYDRGEAVPLGRAIPWLARYQDSWWVVYEGGWLRVTDESTQADLDQVTARLTAAEAAAARDAALRGAFGVTSVQGGVTEAADLARRPVFVPAVIEAGIEATAKQMQN